MKDNVLRKGMVYAIVVLFIGVSIIPLTSSSFSQIDNDIIGCSSLNNIIHISIQPSTQTVEKGETFNVSIYIETDWLIGAIWFNVFEGGLFYESSLIQANSVTSDNFFNGYGTTFNGGEIDNVNGEINGVSEMIFPWMPGDGVSTSGSWVTIEFTAQQELGTSSLNLWVFDVVDGNIGTIFHVFANDGEVIIGGNTPEISNVVLTASEPLDTEPGFGWENVSCTVTDDIGVDEVKLIVTSPDDVMIEYPMTNIVETDIYYVNTTFTDEGCYHYYVWADDIYNNENTSSLMQFELPPNEDVDMNGHIHFMDLVAVALLYCNYGPDGWVREDVDNNGHVGFMDLVAIVLRYGECWEQY